VRLKRRKKPNNLFEVTDLPRERGAEGERGLLLVNTGLHTPKPHKKRGFLGGLLKLKLTLKIHPADENRLETKTSNLTEE